MSENDPGENENVSIEDLRAAANRSNANANAAAAAQRELALVKAGVDTESAVGKLVLTAYDGELTTDAIRTFCADIPGAIPAPKEETPPPPVVEENNGNQQQTDERNRLAGESSGDLLPQGNTRQAATDEFKTAIEQGLPLDEARARQFNTLVGGAMSGDTAVILQDATEKK